jgi:hypothetical protein
MILAIAGKKGSGKDTLADILVDEYDFRKVSLADELKVMCSRIFEYPLDENYNPRLKEKKWSSPIIISPTHVGRISKYLTERDFDVTDEMVNSMLRVGKEKIMETPRQLLQFVGTDMIRNIVDPDVWIKLTKITLVNYEGHAVIPDARFENERLAFRDVGGKLALIVRPSIEIEYSADNHESENQMGSEDDYDFIFYNDSTLAAFSREIKLWSSGKLRQL